jgi:hypothetical protein
MLFFGVMKRIAPRIVLLLVCLLLCVCAGSRNRRRQLPLEEELPASSKEPSFAVPLRRDDVLDYRGNAGKARMPRWFEAYLDGGIAAVEALDEYSGQYAFLSENRGTASGPLEQWLRRFDVDRGFPRLTAARLRARFNRNLAGSADSVYGANYEKAVKAAYNAQYYGCRKEADFWIREESGGMGDTPVYRYFILILVPKSLFERQTRAFLYGMETGNATRSQNSAFNDVRDQFFDGY